MYLLATHRSRGPTGKETYTDLSATSQPVCCLLSSEEAGVCDETVLGSTRHEGGRVRCARTYLYIWGFTTGQHPTRLPRPLRSGVALICHPLAQQLRRCTPTFGLYTGFSAIVLGSVSSRTRLIVEGFLQQHTAQQSLLLPSTAAAAAATKDCDEMVFAVLTSQNVGSTLRLLLYGRTRTTGASPQATPGCCDHPALYLSLSLPSHNERSTDANQHSALGASSPPPSCAPCCFSFWVHSNTAAAGSRSSRLKAERFSTAAEQSV